MNIRIIKKEEFEDLMNLMNFSFGFEKVEDEFEHILPKYYFKDNENMTHLGLFIDEKLISSIGIYPLMFIRKDKTLSAAMIGAVSTHPDYQGKGFFSILMQEVMEYCKDKYDILCLTGKKERYNRFDFEYSGLSVRFSFIGNSNKPRKIPLKLIKLDKNNDKDLLSCIELYNSSFQYVLRTKEDFYKALLSWNNLPYVIKKDNEVVGYITIKDNSFISEFKYKNDELSNIIELLKNNFNEFSILGNYQDIINGLDKLSDKFDYSYNVMYRINNYEKVVDYLDFHDFDKNYYKNLNSLDKVRYIMGNHEDELRDKTTMLFVHNCDQG